MYYQSRKTCSYATPAQSPGARFTQVIVDFLPAIAAVFVQDIPLLEQVCERFRCIRVTRKRSHLLLYPVVQRLHQRYHSGFSDRQSLFYRTAADLRLDSVQRSDTTERFCRYCRWMADMYIVDLVSGMHHTGRFGYPLTTNKMKHPAFKMP